MFATKRDFLLLLVTLGVGTIVGYIFSPREIGTNVSERGKLSVAEICNHNVGVVLLILIVGMLTYGIVAYLLLFINGLSLGIVMANITLGNIIFTLIPYSIFELAAFIIAAFASINLSRQLRQTIKQKNTSIMWQYVGYDKLFLAIVFVFLGSAAILEVHI